MSNVEDDILYMVCGVFVLAVLSLTFLMLNSVAGVSFGEFIAGLVGLCWFGMLCYIIIR